MWFFRYKRSFFGKIGTGNNEKEELVNNMGIFDESVSYSVDDCYISYDVSGGVQDLSFE